MEGSESIRNCLLSSVFSIPSESSVALLFLALLLVDAITPDLQRFHYFLFMLQPLIPSQPYFFFVDICFREFDKERIVSGFTFHESPVKLPEVFIAQSFTQTFKSFTTAGFDKCHREELVQEPVFPMPALPLEPDQFVHVFIFALFAQLETSLFQFSQEIGRR